MEAPREGEWGRGLVRVSDHEIEEMQLTIDVMYLLTNVFI
jgi:hypothetical protein